MAWTIPDNSKCTMPGKVKSGVETPDQFLSNRTIYEKCTLIQQFKTAIAAIQRFVVPPVRMMDCPIRSRKPSTGCSGRCHPLRSYMPAGSARPLPRVHRRNQEMPSTGLLSASWLPAGKEYCSYSATPAPFH